MDITKFAMLKAMSGGSSSGGTLPIASSTTLGGVKIGSGISIDETGVISTNGSNSAFFDITVTTDLQTGAMTADKTYEEIFEKYSAGVIPRVHHKIVYGDSSMNAGYSFGFVYEPGENSFIFYLINGGSGNSITSGGLLPLEMMQINISSTEVKVIMAGVYVSGFEIYGQGGFIMRSSTPQSQKRFCIEVDDSGTISATEVT